MQEIEIDDCWSLIAVVRECAQKVKLAQLTSQGTLTPTTTTTKVNPFESSQKACLEQYVLRNNTNSFVLPSAAGAVNYSSSNDELKHMYVPYQGLKNCYGPIFGGTSEVTPLVQLNGTCNNSLVMEPSLQHQKILQDFQKQGSCAVGVDQNYIHKKKKFEDRWMVRVTSEELAKNDKWAWRKYGQKPIKGSPYPRNYYRCSSMKGCKARKQVERSPMEPNIYVVTYTSHHLHPRPHIRNANGSRVKFTGSEPYPHPKIESPTSIVPDPIRSWYGSKGHVAKTELVDEEVSGGANDESFESEEVDINSNNFLL